MRPMICFYFLPDRKKSLEQTLFWRDDLAEAYHSVSAQSCLHAGPRARLLVVDVACDRHNDQRSNKRHSMSSQHIPHFHFTYLSNKRDKTLESESCSIRRFALGPYFSEIFTRAHTQNTSPTNTNF